MLEPIAYLENSAKLFGQFAHEPWAMYLDSCQLNSEQACYDIIALRPHTTLCTLNGITDIQQQGKKIQSSTKNPFDLIKEFLDTNIKLPKHLPFSGGALGYFSYDLNRSLESLPKISDNDCPLPQMHIHYAPEVV